MSKITNDGLTTSDTRYFNSCTHTATVGVKKLNHNNIVCRRGWSLESCSVYTVFSLVLRTWRRPLNCRVQMLMCDVTKGVKETLQSTVGVVNPASFHALVCSQAAADSAGHVTQQVPGASNILQQTPSDLVGAEMSTFKAATSSSIAIQRMSLPNRLSVTNFTLTLSWQ